MIFVTTFLATVLHVYIVLIALDIREVNSQSELISCNFEMPMDCGFIVRTAAGGIQWSLNQGKSFDGRLYGPPMDHTTGTADGYYASTVIGRTLPLGVVFPVKTDMMTPSIRLPTGEGALVFYFYVWRSVRNDLHGTTLNVYGCQGRKLWGTTVHVAMDGWQRLEIPLQCQDPFEIYFEGWHETDSSSISIDDVTVYSTSSGAGGRHSPIPPNPGTGASIPVSMATKPSGDPPSTLTVTPSGMTTRKLSYDGAQSGFSIILAIVLFLLAALLLSISVCVHVYFWRKHWLRREPAEKPTGVQIQNSAYDCLTLNTGGLKNMRGSPEGNSGSSSLRSNREESTSKHRSKSHIVDMEKHNSHTLDGRRSIRSGKLHRTRSKTMPSKGSQSSFKYYEIVDVDSNGKNITRRAPKLSEIGRSRRISRCNSLPSRSGTYETVDWVAPGLPGGLYHITDLVESPLQPDVFTFESVSSSFDSNYTSQSDNPTYHVLTGITNSQSDDQCSTPSSKVSHKSNTNKKAFTKFSAYDTPKLRKLSSAQGKGYGSLKSPNYFTVQPEHYQVPDVVSTNRPVAELSPQSSQASEVLEGYDELKYASSLGMNNESN